MPYPDQPKLITVNAWNVSTNKKIKSDQQINQYEYEEDYITIV